MRLLSKNTFKVEKSFTDRSAWSENFPRSEKNRSHGNFSLLGQKAVWTNSTSGKEKSEENQYSSSSRKNQEKANKRPSYRCVAIKEIPSIKILLSFIIPWLL